MGNYAIEGGYVGIPDFLYMESTLEDDVDYAGCPYADSSSKLCVAFDSSFDDIMNTTIADIRYPVACDAF